MAANLPPGLPPLRAVIARHGLDARKSLGQHFLLDENLIAAIVRSAGDLGDCEVVEIGPGPGGLTRGLLAAGAKRVVAIEVDRRCLAALAELAEAYPGRLEVIEADGLTVDPAALTVAPRRIIANLPYNVGTRMLVNWLPDAAAFAGFTLMFQKEVADRMMAAPRTADYGRLSVLAQWACEIRRVLDLSPRAFTPPPKVESTVVNLVAHATPPAPARWQDLAAVTAAAFNQRRKMLRASLRTLLPDPQPLLAEAGLLPTARAEEIDVAGFAALARAWQRHREREMTAR